MGQVLCEHWSLCLERVAATEKTTALTKKVKQPVPSRAHGVVVSHPLSMREALGSIPSESTFYFVSATHHTQKQRLEGHGNSCSSILLITNRSLRGSMPSGPAPPRNKNAWTRRLCSPHWRVQMVAVVSLHLPPRSHRASRQYRVRGSPRAMRNARFVSMGPRGVTVSTLDSESSDRGSNPREVFYGIFANTIVCSRASLERIATLQNELQTCLRQRGNASTRTHTNRRRALRRR